MTAKKKTTKAEKPKIKGVKARGPGRPSKWTVQQQKDILKRGLPQFAKGEGLLWLAEPNHPRADGTKGPVPWSNYFRWKTVAYPEITKEFEKAQKAKARR